MNAPLSPVAKMMLDPSTPYMGCVSGLSGNGDLFIKKGCAHDYVDARAAQLASLLQLLHGIGGEAFRGYSAEIQENVLWLASGLADEVREAIELMGIDARAGSAA